MGGREEGLYMNGFMKGILLGAAAGVAADVALHTAKGKRTTAGLQPIPGLFRISGLRPSAEVHSSALHLRLYKYRGKTRKIRERMNSLRQTRRSFPLPPVRSRLRRTFLPRRWKRTLTRKKCFMTKNRDLQRPCRSHTSPRRPAAPPYSPASPPA